MRIETLWTDRQIILRSPTQWAYTQQSNTELVVTKVRNGGVWVAIVQTRAIDRSDRRGMYTASDRYSMYTNDEVVMMNRRIIVCRLRHDDVNAAHPAWRQASDWTRTSRAQIVRVLEDGADTLVPQADDVLSSSGHDLAEIEEIDWVWQRFCETRETILHVAPAPSVEALHRLARATWMTHAHTRWDAWRITNGAAVNFNAYFVPQIVTGLLSVDAVTDSLQIGLWTHPDYSPIRWGVVPAGDKRYTARGAMHTHQPVPYLVAEVRLDGADEAYCFYPADPPREAFWTEGYTRIAEWFADGERSFETTVKTLKDACTTRGVVLAPTGRKRGGEPVKFIIINFDNDGGGSVQRVDGVADNWRVFPANTTVRLALNAEYVGACLQRRSGTSVVRITTNIDAIKGVRLAFSDGSEMLVAPMNLREVDLGTRT